MIVLAIKSHYKVFEPSEQIFLDPLEILIVLHQCIADRGIIILPEIFDPSTNYSYLKYIFMLLGTTYFVILSVFSISIPNPINFVLLQYI